MSDTPANAFTSFEVLSITRKTGLPSQVHGFDDHNIQTDRQHAFDKARKAANRRKKPQAVFQLIGVVWPDNQNFEGSLKEFKKAVQP